MALPFVYKRKVTGYTDGSTTTDSGATAPNLTGEPDVPVLLVIDSNSWNDAADTEANGFLDDFFDGTNNPNGKRCKIYPSEANLIADTNELSYDVLEFDTGSELAIYRVKRTTGASSTEVWIGFGEGATGWATTDQDDQTGTWEATFIGAYPFENDSFNDRTSHAHNGTNDGTSNTTGQVGDARSFGGATDDDKIDLVDADELDGASSFSISFWGQTTTHSTFHTFYAKGGANTLALTLNNFDVNDLFARVSNTSDAFGNTTGSAWPAGTLRHLMVVYDGSLSGNANRLKMYIGGQQETLAFTGTIPATTPSTAVALVLGLYNDGTTDFFLDGIMDEVMVSTAARSSNYADLEHHLAKKTNYPGDNWLVWSAAQAVGAAADAFPVPYVWWQRQNQNYDAGVVNQ